MKEKTFQKAVLRGIASASAIYETSRYRRDVVSDRDAMRGDWLKIGNDFKRAIDRSNARIAKK